MVGPGLNAGVAGRIARRYVRSSRVFVFRLIAVDVEFVITFL